MKADEWLKTGLWWRSGAYIDFETHGEENYIAYKHTYDGHVIVNWTIDQWEKFAMSDEIFF